jgi:hypothetical protein
MQRRIGSLNQQPDTNLEGYPLYFSHNVSHIEPIHDTEGTFGWLITELEKNNTPPLNYYFYIDGKSDEPFGHWVFESGIFLPLFFLLKKQYPSLRILSLNPKKYKDIFYKGFGIDNTEIVSTIEANNTVIFTQWNSLADHNVTRRNEYRTFLDSFYKSLIYPLEKVNKTIDILYLPRGVQENYKSNDRIIPAQETLLDKIQSLFPSTVIYNSDTTNNIREQIHIIRSSKIILLDYGSSLLVNGFFAEDSYIFVIGDFGHVHCKNPKPYLMLQETLKRGCNYMYVPIDCPAMYVLQCMYETIQNGFRPHTHLYTCWKIHELHHCQECMSTPF